MDKFIDARFERLVKALSIFIDSVTKYNPSTTQAEEVSVSDQELTKGLVEVERHQCNHIRIQELREASNALDSQIRDTLASLAAARKDVKMSHPIAAPKEPLFPVNYDELLSYARRISKTTLPPPVIVNNLEASASASASTHALTPEPNALQMQARAQSQPLPTPNPTQSPIPNPAVTQTPALPLPSQQQQQQQQQEGAPNSQNTSLPAVIMDYLNPLTGTIFFPWPSEDSLRMGSLAANQALAEKGIDSRGFDPVKAEAQRRQEEEERREKEEREWLERQAQEKRMREERERLRRERDANILKDETGAQARPPADKKQFQFTNIDDLEDDDDEED